MTPNDKLFFVIWGCVLFPLIALYLSHSDAVVIATLTYMGGLKYLYVKDANEP